MTDRAPASRGGSAPVAARIRRRVHAACAAAVLVSASGVLALFVHRRAAEAQESRRRQEAVEAGPVVRTDLVEVSGGTRTLTLTGEVRAYNQATLYAKVSGYVRRMLVDKGDRVREGQVLAELETPEVEQQVVAARADLALRRQAERRARALAPSGVVSAQELEQAESALKVSEAALAQARVMRSYGTVRAPFDGYVTARFVDPGALVPAATGATASAQPLLDLADMDRLRVQVFLPQERALAAREGDAAVLRLADGTEQRARVTSVTRRLDPRTRTMLAELVVPNVPRRMYPGQFVTVELQVARAARPTVRSDALVFQGQSTRVALLEGHRVKLVPVTTGEHDGARVEVLQGLRGGERVVLNAGALPDGAAVQPVTDGAGAPGGAPATASPPAGTATTSTDRSRP